MNFDHNLLLQSYINNSRNLTFPLQPSLQHLRNMFPNLDMTYGLPAITKKLKTDHVLLNREKKSYPSCFPFNEISTTFANNPLEIAPQYLSNIDFQNNVLARNFQQEATVQMQSIFHNQSLQTRVPINDKYVLGNIPRMNITQEEPRNLKHYSAQNLVPLIGQNIKISSGSIKRTQNIQDIRAKSEDFKSEVAKKDMLQTSSKKPIVKTVERYIQQKNIEKVVKSSGRQQQAEFIQEIRACDIIQGNKTLEFSSFTLNLGIKTSKDNCANFESKSKLKL